MRRRIAVWASSTRRIAGCGSRRIVWTTRRGTRIPTSSSRSRRRSARSCGGAGRGSETFRTTTAWIAIDGEAGTPITQWDGRRRSLGWTEYDVTSLPYHLRRGEAAVIGVGGGRDLLTALWGRSRVTGIEVNGILIEALRGPYREFANLAGARRRDARPRRGAVVSEPRRSALRRAPDVAHRHLGGDRCRGVHALGERALHARGLEGVPRVAHADGRLQCVTLVLPRGGLGNDPDSRAWRGRAPGSGRARAVAPPADGRTRRRGHAARVACAVRRARPPGDRRSRRTVRVPGARRALGAARATPSSVRIIGARTSSELEAATDIPSSTSRRRPTSARSSSTC